MALVPVEMWGRYLQGPKGPITARVLVQKYPLQSQYEHLSMLVFPFEDLS